MPALRFAFATLAVIAGSGCTTSPQVTSTESGVSDGTSAYLARDYARAVREFSEAGDRGDGVALMNLSLMYSVGCGANADQRKSEEFLGRAANAGEPTAKFMLELAAMFGTGKHRFDEAEYRKAVDAAAERGFPLAMLYKGKTYESSRERPDPIRAYAWYSLAAKRAPEPMLREDIDRLKGNLSSEDLARAESLTAKLDAQTSKSPLVATRPCVQGTRAIAAPSGRVHPRMFTVVDLGLGAGVLTSGYALSPSGKVVGAVGDLQNFRSQRTDSLFFYDIATGTRTVVKLEGEGWPYAINDAGYVASTVREDKRGPAAIFKPNGQMVDVRRLGQMSTPRSINSHGAMTGSFSKTTRPIVNHAFVFSAEGGMQEIDVGCGESADGVGAHTIGASINDSGQVTGWSNCMGSDGAAFLYSPGKRTRRIPTLGGSYNSAEAINNAGVVAGYSMANLWGSTEHAFTFSERDGLHDLGTLNGKPTFGRGINNAGHVVGEARIADMQSHAIMWSPELGLFDLNSAIAPDSDWELVSARAISDGGHILGSGKFKGALRVFLLIPTSTP